MHLLRPVMRYIIALALILLGTTLGLIGDAPINHLAYSSFALMVIGGLLLAAGFAVLLLSSARINSRGDEPYGHIRP